MKLGIYVVVALLISAFAAHFLLANPGYVLIDFRDYKVEMSVPVLVFFIALLMFAVWLIRRILIAPRLLGEAAGRYRAGRAGQKLTRGMIEVAEGNFARGEKLLARAAHSSDSPLFNYLQAARAAHLQGKPCSDGFITGSRTGSSSRRYCRGSGSSGASRPPRSTSGRFACTARNWTPRRTATPQSGYWPACRSD